MKVEEVAVFPVSLPAVECPPQCNTQPVIVSGQEGLRDPKLTMCVNYLMTTALTKAVFRLTSKKGKGTVKLIRSEAPSSLGNILWSGVPRPNG